MAQVLDETGYSGLANFSGIIQEDFLREFHGREGYKRYNEMRLNSPPIGALLLAIENAIRPIQWYYKSEEGDTDPRVQFLEDIEQYCSHSWNDHVSEALTFIPFGFSMFALWYERDERGRIVWRKFLSMGQNTVYRWDIAEDGSIKGFWQQALPSYDVDYIPIERMILYRSRVEKNNPEGRSILRNAWIPYYFAKHIQQIEAIGVERDLAGMPVVKGPQGADMTVGSEDYSVAHKMVRNLRRDEQDGIVLPYGWDVILLSTGGSRQFDTDKIINRYDSRMLMSALAQFLLLGQEGVGSLALSGDQTNFFTMSVNTMADIIAETFSKYAIPRLLELNGFDPDGITLEHTPAGDIGVEVMAAALQSIGDKLTWTPKDESWLRQVMRLPEMSEEELTAQAAEKKAADAAAQAAELEKAKANNPAAFQPQNGQPPTNGNGNTPPPVPPRQQVAQMITQFQDALTKFRVSIGERTNGH